MLDQAAPPQRLEQRVAEAQRHEILHGFLAQIMIDAVDLPFGEHGADLLVDEIGGSGVVTQRFFQHHPRQRGDRAGFGEILAEQREQIRRRGKEEHAHELLAALQRGGEGLVVRSTVRLDLGVVQQAAERLPERRVEFRAEKSLTGGFRLRNVLAAGKARAGNAENARFGGNLSCRIATIQRRQQLARDQIAGSAKKHHVKSR